MAEQPKRRRIRKRWIFLIVVSVLVFVAIGAHLIWIMSARRTLEAQIAEYKELGEPIERHDFDGYGVVPGLNAIPNLQIATQSIDPKTPTWEAFDELEITRPFPLREEELKVLRELIAQESDALPYVEAASKCPGVDWTLSYNGSIISVMLPSLNQYRALANLLRADALIAHTDADDTRAVRRTGEILFLSRVMGKQPILVSHIVGNGIAVLSAELLADLAPDIRIGTAPGEASPEQVREIIAQLLDERHASQSQRDALLGERMFQLEMIRDMNGGTLSYGTRPGTQRRFLGYVLLPTFLGDATIAIRHTTDLRKAAAASRDWPAFQRVAPKVPPSVNERWWLHYAAKIVIAGLDRSIQAHYSAMAERRMAAVALALRMYALDHGGQFPKSLDALVPTYLPAVPLDPTSDGHAICYSSDEPDPRIWTLGDNGRDDGGKDIVPTESVNWNKENTDRVVHLHRQPRPNLLTADDLNAMEEPATEPVAP